MRSGDWDCSKCGNNNFASRTNCRRCQEPKGEALRAAKILALSIGTISIIIKTNQWSIQRTNLVVPGIAAAILGKIKKMTMVGKNSRMLG
jgi:hypothetical protein